MFKITALFVLLSVGAYAGPITWTLQGVTFADGGTASGSFVYDATADIYSSFNIATTNGSSLSGATYTVGSPAWAAIDYGGALELYIVTSNAANLAGTPELRFVWASTLTDAGGTIGFKSSPVSQEATCASTNCSVVASPSRLISGGSISSNGAAATPEPATFALVGCALGFLGWKRRSLTVRSRQ